MKIIAHRGEWSQPNEKNSIYSFSKALRNGFGVETDIRDYNGQLVISHDVPVGSEIPLGDFFELYQELLLGNNDQILALNIKSDGISNLLSKMLEQYNIRNYFVFDMSVPDTMSYFKAQMKFYSRVSELEAESDLHVNSNGVWLDQFHDTWYSPEYITSLVEKYERVCVVSPELHSSPRLQCWRMLKKIPEDISRNIALCTDLPTKAKDYFNE